MLQPGTVKVFLMRREHVVQKEDTLLTSSTPGSRAGLLYPYRRRRQKDLKAASARMGSQENRQDRFRRLAVIRIMR